MFKTRKAGQKLHDQVKMAIATNPYLNLTKNNVDFQTHGNCVTLRGKVDSFYQKQMAQEALRRVDGVEEIENLLEVNW